MNQIGPVSAMFAGGGEMAGLMRAHDWTNFEFGAPLNWPEALQSASRTMLSSAQAMFIVCGRPYQMLYNDAYASLLQPRHPATFGNPFFDVWPELVDSVGPLLRRAVRGESFFVENMALRQPAGAPVRERNFMVSYTPISLGEAADAKGDICVLGIANEITQKTIASAERDAQLAAFARLVEQAPGFVAVLEGPEHRFRMVNPAYRQLIGHHDMVGKTVAEALSAHTYGRYLKLLNQVLNTGQPIAEKGALLNVQAHTGATFEERFIDFVYQPIVDDAGAVTGIFVQGSDVTGRVEAEAALRASEARLQALNAGLETEIAERLHERDLMWRVSPDLLAVMSLDGNFEALNPAWTDILGWREADFAGKSYLEFLHPDDRERSQAAFRRIPAGGPIVKFENRYRTRGGDYRWLSWAAAHEGAHIYCSARDVTIEKALQAELAAATAAHDRLWNSSQDLLTVIDLNGVFKALSPVVESILGLTPAQMIERPIFDFIVEEDQVASRDALREAAEGKLPVYTNRYKLENGSQRAIAWRAVRKGDLIYATGRDVTSELESAEALRQAQKMEAVGQLTGGLAHDFNNLLQSIGTSLELLQSHAAEGRTASLGRYIGVAQDAAARAAALTHRLLAFSRRQTLEPKPTQVGGLVSGMADLLCRLLGPEFTIDITQAAEPWNTFVDPHQLENVLLNLSVNARDAMPDGGRLTIGIGNEILDEAAAHDMDLPPGEYVALDVHDTGAGMTPAVAQRAFDPFFTTKPLGSGTGLGLSMVYGFARQSGGAARIQSVPGQGTLVRLYLPRHIGVAVAQVTVAPFVDGRATPVGGTILLVDDEDTVRILLGEELVALGYTVIEAADGAAGLAVMRSDAQIDLLVTDVGLPGGMNGRQMADAGRKLRPSLNVLFITGYAEQAVLKNGMLEPGMQVLTKPFPIGVLAARLRELAGDRAWAEA